MNNNLERVKSFLEEQKFQRVLDVLKAFGLSLPNNFEIYSVLRGYYETLNICEDNLDEEENYHDYAIILKENEHPLEFEDKDLSAIECLPKIKFSDDDVEIIVEKEGILYNWNKSNKTEMISCTKNDEILEISFSTYEDGIETSELIFAANFYTLIYGLSEITEVKFTKRINSEKTEEKIFPIKEYYKVLEKYLNSEETKQYIPEVLNKKEVLLTILKVLKDAIADMVYKLENDNQNWRFAKELEKIEIEYTDALTSADEDYQAAIEAAGKKLAATKTKAEETKAVKKRKLTQKQKNYIK